MPFLGLVKAEYDYSADGEDELSISENDILFLLDDSDAEWWKVRVKPASADISSADSPQGLVPASYLTHCQPTEATKASYAYEATTEEEITVAEDEDLHVLVREQDWTLVQRTAGQSVGYMPTAYLGDVADTAAEESQDVYEEAAEEPDQEPYNEPEPAFVPTAPPPPPVFAFQPPPARIDTASAVSKDSAKYGIVQFDFSGEAHDELTVNENDRVIIVNNTDADWWLVKRTTDNKEGLVPATYVEAEDDASPAHNASIHEVPETLASHDSDEHLANSARQVQIEADQKEAQRLQSNQDPPLSRRERKEQEARELNRAKGIMVDVPLPPPQPARRAERKSEKKASSVPIAPAAPTISPPVASKSTAKAETERKKPSKDKVRIWKDRSSQFKVEAEFLGVQNGKLRLHKSNGVIIDVPLERMSPEDIAYIRKLDSKRRGSVGSDDAPKTSEREKERERRHRHREVKEAKEREAAKGGASTPPVPQQTREQQAKAAQAGKPKQPTVDWFEFFLNAGCEIDDCSRYANNFERDRIDEEVMPELEASTLRSLGLREGDLIRVRKHIKTKYGRTAADIAGSKDDDKVPESKDGGSLFTNAAGGLKTTRRGRPENKERSSSTSVSASGLSAASEELIRIGTPPVAKTPELSSRSRSNSTAVSTTSGFDDDAWTVKAPAKARKASPVPTPRAPTPPLVEVAKADPEKEKQSLADDILARLGVPNRPSSVPAQSAAQQPYNPNAPRGPVAPIIGNAPLLNPLIPTSTGFTGFIPTRPASAGNFNAVNAQPTGFLPPQQTGFLGAQPTGYIRQQPTYASPQLPIMQTMAFQPQPTGFSSMPAYSQALSTSLAPQPTGIFAQQPALPASQTNGGYLQPQITGFAQTQTLFTPNQPNRQMSAPSPLYQQPQPTGSTPANRYDPTNVFAAMKQGSNTPNMPQQPGTYDALRPQPTAFGQMIPQQTGFYQQPGQFYGQY